MDIDDSLALNDPRVIQASREYLADVDEGRQPDRRKFYDRAPDLKEVLSEVFDGIDLASVLRPRPAVPTESLAEPLGDFRIVRQLGQGGMGIVYEAVQLSLGRKVALKVLPFAASLDARTRHRFQVEAQAAALLHHTNIVPVYAVGCERGLHFYAMQLIEGGSLAEYISAQRELNAHADVKPAEESTLRGNLHSTSANTESKFSNPPKNRRLLIRAMVEMTAKIADALEYAHQSGTIHRDIKPANLMLDHSGNVWITDFGLAHVATDVSLTATGDMVGTMRYMSPEQAGGQRAVLDGRTDIYSLGATLYELLTLHPVFEGTSRHTLLSQILLEDPKPLRNWDRTIPVEVETIVLKCLSKIPGERYSTAAELAADLRRYLDERPILARRPTVIESARKWLRRHPSIMWAMALILIAGFVGLGITAGIVAHQQQLTQEALKGERHQQQLTQQALKRERERAEEAERRFDMARTAADQMFFIAQNDLADMPFQDNARRRLLSGALQYYQEFILLKQSSKDPAELKETRDLIAEILRDLEAMEELRQLVMLREPAVLDDLRVTAQQREQLENIEDPIELGRPGMGPPEFQGDPAARRELMANARKNAAALERILTAVQMERLHQLVLQWEGPRVFFSPRVTDLLKITPEQRIEIRKIEHHWLHGDDDSKGPHRFVRPDGSTIRPVILEILQVLTPEQRNAWETLTGPPYMGPIGDPFWDNRPGRRRGP